MARDDHDDRRDRDPRGDKDRDLRRQRRTCSDADKALRKTRRRVKTNDRRRERRAHDVALHNALAEHGDGDLVDFDTQVRQVNRMWREWSVPLGEWVADQPARRACREVHAFVVGPYAPDRDRERYERYLRQLMESRSLGTVEVARAFAEVLGLLAVAPRSRYSWRDPTHGIEAFFRDVPELREPFEQWLESQLELEATAKRGSR